jgi:hypothetical protein
MGAGASARFGELPEVLDLQDAQNWAEKLGMPPKDWPEEKWVELTGSAEAGSIGRDAFVHLCRDLLRPIEGLSASNGDGDDEVFAVDNSGGDDEEVI